jgi:hypothetical protein
MALRIPSAERIVSGLTQTLYRFPFESLTALFGTTAYYYMVTADADNRLLFTKLTLTATLGLVYFLSAGLYVRSTGRGNIFYVITQLLIAVLLVVYYFTLPDFIQDTHIQRYIILNAVGHLAVSFAPFLHKRNVNAFWHYNKILFIRILTSGLYSVVLFGGLAGVLGSLQALFGIDIDGDTYLILGCTIFGMFNTLFFLSAVPLNPDNADEDSSYPVGLTMFTQYVLIPLVSIYMAILFAYEAKILITFNLPKGWISALIIAFSIVGILANLLVYPLRENSDKGWIRFFARWFYLLMMPLLVLFYWAVLHRIYEYGFTEERYYLLITAIWLTGISLYFVFSKYKNILFIPITLALLGLFSQFSGPLSAASVSLRSQLTRLEEVLNDEAIKTDGNKQKQAIEIMQYCMQTHGFETMLPIFGEEAKEILDEKINEPARNFRYVNKDECYELLELKGIAYMPPVKSETETAEAAQYVTVNTEYSLDKDQLLSVNGYSYVFDIDLGATNKVTLPSGDILAININKYNAITFNLNDKIVHTESVASMVKQIDAGLNNKQKSDRKLLQTGKLDEDMLRLSLKSGQLTFPVKLNDKLELTVIFDQLVIEEQVADSTMQILNWSGKILIR